MSQSTVTEKRTVISSSGGSTVDDALADIGYKPSFGSRASNIMSRSIASPMRHSTGGGSSVVRTVEYGYGSAMGGGFGPGGYSNISGSGVSSVKTNREREKKDMQDLNERFANYIEKVRFLEAQNKKLGNELDELRSKWGKETGHIKQMYEAELAEARKLIDDLSRDKAALEIKMSSIQEQFNDLNRQLEDARNWRQADREQINKLNQQLADYESEISMLRRTVESLETERGRDKANINRLQQEVDKLRIDLNNETLAHLDAENRRQTLEEEMEFMKKVHEQELKELAALAYRDTTAENREFWKNELGQAIRDIQQEYDAKVDQLRGDMEGFYNLKIQEYRTGATKQNMEVTHVREENKKITKQMSDLRGKLADMEARNAQLEKQYQELLREFDSKDGDHMMEVTQLREEISKLRAEMEGILSELQTIMDVKLSLELEIAAYRKLLEGEENRVDWRSRASLIMYRDALMPRQNIGVTSDTKEPVVNTNRRLEQEKIVQDASSDTATVSSVTTSEPGTSPKGEDLETLQSSNNKLIIGDGDITTVKGSVKRSNDNADNQKVVENQTKQFEGKPTMVSGETHLPANLESPKEEHAIKVKEEVKKIDSKIESDNETQLFSQTKDAEELNVDKTREPSNSTKDDTATLSSGVTESELHEVINESNEKIAENINEKSGNQLNETETVVEGNATSKHESDQFDDNQHNSAHVYDPLKDNQSISNIDNTDASAEIISIDQVIKDSPKQTLSEDKLADVNEKSKNEIVSEATSKETEESYIKDTLVIDQLQILNQTSEIKVSDLSKTESFEKKAKPEVDENVVDNQSLEPKTSKQLEKETDEVLLSNTKINETEYEDKPNDEPINEPALIDNKGKGLADEDIKHKITDDETKLSQSSSILKHEAPAMEQADKTSDVSSISMVNKMETVDKLDVQPEPTVKEVEKPDEPVLQDIDNKHTNDNTIAIDTTSEIRSADAKGTQDVTQEQKLEKTEDKVLETQIMSEVMEDASKIDSIENKETHVVTGEKKIEKTEDKVLETQVVSDVTEETSKISSIENKETHNVNGEQKIEKTEDKVLETQVVSDVTEENSKIGSIENKETQNVTGEQKIEKTEDKVLETQVVSEVTEVTSNKLADTAIVELSPTKEKPHLSGVLNADLNINREEQKYNDESIRDVLDDSKGLDRDASGQINDMANAKVRNGEIIEVSAESQKKHVAPDIEDVLKQPHSIPKEISDDAQKKVEMTDSSFVEKDIHTNDTTSSLTEKTGGEPNAPEFDKEIETVDDLTKSKDVLNEDVVNEGSDMSVVFDNEKSDQHISTKIPDVSEHSVESVIETDKSLNVLNTTPLINKSDDILKPDNQNVKEITVPMSDQTDAHKGDVENIKGHKDESSKEDVISEKVESNSMLLSKSDDLIDETSEKHPVDLEESIVDTINAEEKQSAESLSSMDSTHFDKTQVGMSISENVNKDGTSATAKEPAPKEIIGVTPIQNGEIESPTNETKKDVTGTSDGDDSQMSMKMMRGEVSAKTTYQRTSTGPIAISEVSPEGKFIMLENTSSGPNRREGKKKQTPMDVNLDGWRLRRSVDGKRDYIYKFRNFTLKSGKSVKILARNSAAEAGLNDLVFRDEDNWGVGSQVTTALVNDKEEDKATHVQKTLYN